MKAVCIVSGDGWRKLDNYTWFQRQRYIFTGKRPKEDGPQLGEVNTVENVFTGLLGEAMLVLNSYPGYAYEAICFRPLLSNEQEALDRIEQEVNEEEPAFA